MKSTIKSNELAVEVFDMIHTVMHRYRAQQYRGLRDGAHGLTHMESKVLGFFARHPGATQSDLVARVGRDKAQLARLIKGLRDKGLLDAQPDPEDRRNIRLSVTAAGEALQQEAQEQGRVLAVAALDGLSDAQCQHLVALLETVNANLEREP